jgi:hypothetical protein
LVDTDPVRADPNGILRPQNPTGGTSSNQTSGNPNTTLFIIGGVAIVVVIGAATVGTPAVTFAINTIFGLQVILFNLVK